MSEERSIVEATRKVEVNRPRLQVIIVNPTRGETDRLCGTPMTINQLCRDGTTRLILNFETIAALNTFVASLEVPKEEGMA